MLSDVPENKNFKKIEKKGMLQKLIIFYVYFNVLTIYFALSKTTL